MIGSTGSESTNLLDRARLDLLCRASHTCIAIARCDAQSLFWTKASPRGTCAEAG